MARESDKLRAEISGKNILVVGDLVADQFLRGTIDRVSREAPVFILKHDSTETVPGGAANAAANAASLGASVAAVGVVGGDPAGDSLKAALLGAGVSLEGVIVEPSRMTTTKLRVLAGQEYAPRQQVLRIDYEDKAEAGDELEEVLIAKFWEQASNADAIVVSDYGYGAVSRGLWREITSFASANGIPVLADSRFRLKRFEGALAATPNKEETEELIGGQVSAERCESLRNDLGLKALLVTLGKDGMLLLAEGNPPLRIPAVGGDEPVDVTGAGDTVIAVFSLAIASGFGFEAAARIANHAGGIVVMKRGTSTVSLDELTASLDSGAEEGADSLSA